ncbi:ABC transporter ATP-binding protein [Natronomonas sp.]|uniref:ABC transporter ATP-binding protein n=1 Tax=Natronomonas sp. TaxID=2184060 RepID=UPI002630A7C5|nr:ABC transporter ATP-binding protein [Natronomonas sp.]
MSDTPVSDRASPPEGTLAGEVGSGGTDAADEPALVIEGLSKRFGAEEGVVAVDDVSFSVDRGAVVGLLGPNGAGKTTLIKCALGIVVPDSGSIRVFGTDVAAGRRAVYADVDAMLEGARNDYWRLTVRENLRYFATIRGVDPDSVRARHDRLLDRFDLAAKADTPVRELSRGMKQKVSLASALAGGAALVFLDEPTLGLDVESSRTLRRELRRLADEEGLTIVLSGHDMGVIESVCDRVIVMSEGRVVADDAVSALLERADRNRVRLAATGVDRSVLDSLRRDFDVYEVSRNGRRTRLEFAAGGTELYDLMDALRAGGVTIEDVRTVDPDLEDVFLTLTEDAPTTDERGETP